MRTLQFSLAETCDRSALMLGIHKADMMRYEVEKDKFGCILHATGPVKLVLGAALRNGLCWSIVQAQTSII